MKGTLQTPIVILTACVFLAIGCKGPQDQVSPQKVIDNEVEKVVLDVSGKMGMTASELMKDKITASGYDSAAYEIEYRDIKPDDAKRIVSATFILKKKSLQSKVRTVTIAGFKIKDTINPPPPPVPETENITIEEAELLSAIGLTKGDQTASAAAKKVAAEQGHTVGALTLTKAQAISYDDEAGTFTVKIKGNKNGKTFEQEITVSGFTHPYASALTAVKNCTFNLDAAIEDNLSIDKYIEKINQEIQKHLTFEVLLENQRVISLGDTDTYRFTVQASNDTGELKVSNINYTLKYRKCSAGGTETAEEKPYNTMQNIVRKQKKPYFMENDVFTYILKKTDDSFIKASNNEFASSFSAFAKAHGSTPNNLLDMIKIQKYIALYDTKDADEHLPVKIAAGLYNAKNGTINANDVEGTLTLQYCITTEEKLADHINNSSESTITAISKPVTKSGFRKTNAETLKALFEFKVEKQGGGTAANAQTAWCAYQFPTSSNNWPLLSEDYKAKQLPSFNGKPFRITINAGDTPKDFFAVENVTHLSKGSGDVKILLKGAVLNKTAGTTDLTVTFMLSDNKTVDVTYPHAIH